jgi:hypothetical protein
MKKAPSFRKVLFKCGVRLGFSNFLEGDIVLLMMLFSAVGQYNILKNNKGVPSDM